MDRGLSRQKCKQFNVFIHLVLLKMSLSSIKISKRGIGYVKLKISQKRLNKADRVKHRFCEGKKGFAQNRLRPSRKQHKKYDS